MKKAILISVSAAVALFVLGGVAYAQTATACPMMGHASTGQSSGSHMANHGMAGMPCPMMATDGDPKPSGMQGMKHGDAASAASHSGTASIRSIDPARGTVTLAHGPIESIKWSAMTMEFKLKEKSLAEGLRVGDSVTFQFLRSGHDYVVTDIRVANK